MPELLQQVDWGAVVGYVVAAWAVDLDVANGILPGYIMGLYFFTGYALRLQVKRWSSHFSRSFYSLQRLPQHVHHATISAAAVLFIQHLRLLRCLPLLCLDCC